MTDDEILLKIFEPVKDTKIPVVGTPDDIDEEYSCTECLHFYPCYEGIAKCIRGVPVESKIVTPDEADDCCSYPHLRIEHEKA